MAIPVVVGDVQKRGGAGPEPVARLKLEAAHLSHEPRAAPISLWHAGHDPDQRGADVPADADREARLLEHLAREGRRCRLAVGPGHADQGHVRPEAEGRLDLADDLNPALARRPEVR